MKTVRKSGKKKASASPRELSLDQRLVLLVQQSEAGIVRLDKLEKVMAARDEAAARRSEADLARLVRMDKAIAEERKMGENRGRRLSRALEDAFAASLPRVMKTAHKIIIKPEDIRMRARKNNRSAEFDFVAPNGELVLAGEVKTRLTLKDVKAFVGALTHDFREVFPEYANLPVYGVVAGGEIDADAADWARKRGFYILRLEGAEVHPETARGYRATAY